MQQLLFQQTYSLLFGWLLIAQTEYESRDKGCEDIPRQSKDFGHSRKLTKVVAIWKLNKLVLSKKYMSLKTRGSVGKSTLLKK